MSKLFKSKFLVGIMLVSVLVVGGFAIATTTHAQQAVVSASDIQYAATVKLGSTGQASLIWQKFLNGYSTANLVADGKFGKLSEAAAKIWQASRNLKADGVLGALSRASAMAQIASGVTNPVGNTYPAGCSSFSGYSATTGLSCAGVMTYPAGCTSNVGYSMTTGQSCAAVTSFPAGCTSAVGFSPTTGMACNGVPATVTYPAGCTSFVGFSPTTGMSCASGTPGVNPSAAGNISTDSVLGGFASTVVGQGDPNHQVAGFQLTGAGGGSNLTLSNMTIQFNEDPAATGMTGSSRFNDYFNAVSVYEGSTLIGTVPASSFSSNSTALAHYVYSASIPLSNATVLAGQQNNFYVAITANSSMDSGNFNQNLWKVQVSNIRFTDGTGMTLVYTPTSAIGTAVAAFTGAPAFSFGSTASANNIVLNIARSGSDMNAHTVTVTSNSGATYKVPLLLMTLTSQGGQAISVNQIPVVFTPTAISAPTQVYKMAGEVYLMNGTTVLDSEAVPSTGNCATNNTACTISFKINPSNPLIVTGTTTLTVAADINSITGGNYAAGDSLTVSTPGATTAYDLTSLTPNGSELVTSGNATTIIPGTANGQKVAFYSTGVTVAVTPYTCTANNASSGDNSYLSCVIPYSITATGAPAYIPQSGNILNVGTNNQNINFEVVDSTGADVTLGASPALAANVTVAQVGTNATAGLDGGGTANWVIASGQTAYFSATVILSDPTSVHAGQYRSFLTAVNWLGTNPVAHAYTSSYTFNLGSTNSAVPGYTYIN